MELRTIGLTVLCLLMSLGAAGVTWSLRTNYSWLTLFVRLCTGLMVGGLGITAFVFPQRLFVVTAITGALEGLYLILIWKTSLPDKQRKAVLKHSMVLLFIMYVLAVISGLVLSSNQRGVLITILFTEYLIEKRVGFVGLFQKLTLRTEPHPYHEEAGANSLQNSRKEVLYESIVLLAHTFVRISIMLLAF